MVHLLNFLMLLSTISSRSSAAAHFIYPRQMHSPSTSDPSSTTTSSTSTTSDIMQTYNGSHITSSPTEISPSTSNVNSSVVSFPTPLISNGFDGFGPYAEKNLKNYGNIKSGFCDLADNFCSFKDNNGTVIKASPRSMDDQCVLWDASCSGNKTLAMEKFFDIAFPDRNDTYDDTSITGNDCFAQAQWIPQADCVTYNPPERLLEWQKIKDWMRSSQCVSAAEEWQNMTGRLWGFIFEGGVNESYSDWHSFYGSSIPGPSCCSFCNVYAENVDIYYWPEPDTNLSCLATIGGSVRPLDYGATKKLVSSANGYDGLLHASTETYWACNTTDPEFPGTTYTDLTTAIVTTIGHVAAKVPLFNPWDPSPCVGDYAESQGSNHSLVFRDGNRSIRARDHSLVIPSSITQNNDLPVSTIVSEGFTL